MAIEAGDLTCTLSRSDFSTRAWRCLQHLQITTVDALMRSERQLFKLMGCGPATMKELKAYLQSEHLRFDPPRAAADKPSVGSAAPPVPVDLPSSAPAASVSAAPSSTAPPSPPPPPCCLSSELFRQIASNPASPGAWASCTRCGTEARMHSRQHPHGRVDPLATGGSRTICAGFFTGVAHHRRTGARHGLPQPWALSPPVITAPVPVAVVDDVLKLLEGVQRRGLALGRLQYGAVTLEFAAGLAAVPPAVVTPDQPAVRPTVPPSTMQSSLAGRPDPLMLSLEELEAIQREQHLTPSLGTADLMQHHALRRDAIKALQALYRLGDNAWRTANLDPTQEHAVRQFWRRVRESAAVAMDALRGYP